MKTSTIQITLHYSEVRQPPVLIDPLKELQGYTAAVASGLTKRKSRYQLIREMGGYPADNANVDNAI